MEVTLYPVKARHTRPLVCGIAKAMARCNAICDLFSDIVLTDEQVHNHAVTAFRAFCESQEVDNLTDDMKVLEAMYTSAYEQMYHTRYSEMLSNLEKMAVERNLNCAD